MQSNWLQIFTFYCRIIYFQRNHSDQWKYNPCNQQQSVKCQNDWTLDFSRFSVFARQKFAVSNNIMNAFQNEKNDANVKKLLHLIDDIVSMRLVYIVILQIMNGYRWKMSFHRHNELFLNNEYILWTKFQTPFKCDESFKVCFKITKFISSQYRFQYMF